MRPTEELEIVLNRLNLEGREGVILEDIVPKLAEAGIFLRPKLLRRLNEALDNHQCLGCQHFFQSQKKLILHLVHTSDCKYGQKKLADRKNLTWADYHKQLTPQLSKELDKVLRDLRKLSPLMRSDWIQHGKKVDMRIAESRRSTRLRFRIMKALYNKLVVVTSGEEEEGSLLPQSLDTDLDGKLDGFPRMALTEQKNVENISVIEGQLVVVLGAKSDESDTDDSV